MRARIIAVIMTAAFFFTSGDGPLKTVQFRKVAVETETSRNSHDEKDKPTLTGWAGIDRRSSLQYDNAERELEYLLQASGRGKAEAKVNYEIVTGFNIWQDGNTSSSSLKTLSYKYTPDNQSDLGLLYAAADDYNGDGIADLISFRTEAETDESGGSWIRLHGQLDECGQHLSTYNFGDWLNDNEELFFIVIGNYLIKINRNYEHFSMWPLSEKETGEHDLTFCETIEVQNLNNLYDIIFCSKREVGNYLPDDYNYLLEIEEDKYFWNLNYTTSDKDSLHEIYDEKEMISIIEEKLENLVGEPVISLLPLRWENRWSALLLTDSTSALQIKTITGPANVEERENGNKRVGTGSFVIETIIPGKSSE